MQKFDWSQVKRFYEARSSYWERGNYDDPDALGNVVMTGEPLWVNRYFARSQQMAYQALFDLMPSPRPGARALDIGCGAGRWARLLSEHGYQTVGIDLQPALIEAARRRYPSIEFISTSVQEYPVQKAPFDLVSSIEVIRHNPFEEQLVIIRKMRESLVEGGYVIMLEGIGTDPRPNAFYRAIDDWIEVFERSGFRNIAVQRYYYNLIWRAVLQLASMRKRLASRFASQGSIRGESSPEKTGLTPEESAAIPKPERGYLSSLIRRLVLELNAPVESFLIQKNPALPVGDCGFLFQAV